MVALMAAAFPPSTSAAAGAWPRAQVRAAWRGPDVPLRCGPALRPRPAFPSGAGGSRRRRCRWSPPRDGGPRRAGPLRGRLLAGAGLRRAGLGGAAGRRVRRRLLLRPAHLRGRHRHLPQPHLVGVLVRRKPGGAAGGAARRRGAGAAQGRRGQPAAGAGARPQPPPLLCLRSRIAIPRRCRRAGAAARPEPAGPPRRLRQDLLKTRLSKLLPLKVGEVLQIMEREFPTQCNRILSWNNLCNHCGLCIKWTHRAISLPNAPISVLDWVGFLWAFSPFQNIN